ncbi:MAG TPA: RluA family pseudouridine synthase [Thermoanaerobaculia bacterium]|nr:RluA family pseudouridine synthase [Thermoanaerobaculia bacterium]HUM29093.1 RluA family pseudouridine synthase [Thermoanaerobaculia bacterium]HXK67470.1 RluA family pseudouridine synthase [Thermoanaerobaculia bacterium]
MDTFRLEVLKPERRLDTFLACCLPELSRAALARLVRAGHVRVNGREARPSRPLSPGDVVEGVIPPPVPSQLIPEPMDLSILFQDEHILVLNKPAGLCVHPGAGRSSGTIVHGLLAMGPGLSSIGGVERPGIVHRLDKDTSGCLVVALHDRAHDAMARAFKARRVHKVYLAAVWGCVPFDEYRMDGPIRRHPVHRKKMQVGESGRDAQTLFLTRERKERFSLVEARPITGRTHQIRVHLAHLGYPIVGDETYARNSGRQYIDRQALHAWVIAFPHPITGESLEIEAPLPGDMVDLILNLGFALPVLERSKV